MPDALSVTTYNVNGIRSCATKGFAKWVASRQPDLLCLQETRLDDEETYRSLVPEAYGAALFPARKKGYAGTSTLWRLPSMREPEDLKKGFGEAEYDAEGRTLVSRIPLKKGSLVLVNLYAPSGSAGPHRQASKDRWMEAFLPWAKRLAKKEPYLLIVGDFNIAHTERDLARPAENEESSGFLPREREWLTRLLGIGLVDVMRTLTPLTQGPYTWWTFRAGAWDRDVGWRIDYQIANPALAERARSFRIDRAFRGSDHAPLTIEYQI